MSTRVIEVDVEGILGTVRRSLLADPSAQVTCPRKGYSTISREACRTLRPECGGCRAGDALLEGRAPGMKVTVSTPLARPLCRVCKDPDFPPPRGRDICRPCAYDEREAAARPPPPPVRVKAAKVPVAPPAAPVRVRAQKVPAPCRTSSSSPITNSGGVSSPPSTSTHAITP